MTRTLVALPPSCTVGMRSSATSVPAFICAPTSALMPEMGRNTPSLTSSWAAVSSGPARSAARPTTNERSRSIAGLRMVTPPAGGSWANARWRDDSTARRGTAAADATLGEVQAGGEPSGCEELLEQYGALYATADIEARVLDQLPQHGLGLEAGLRDLAGRAGVPRVVGVDRLKRGHDVIDALEREQALAGGDELAEGGVLRDHRPTGREVARAPIAEPAAPQSHVLVLGHRELAARARDVRAIRLHVVGQRHRVDEPPAVSSQQGHRLRVLLVTRDPAALAVAGVAPDCQGQLERLRRPTRQVDHLEELVMLAPRVGLALPLHVLARLPPARHRREAGTRRAGRGLPPVEHDGRPRRPVRDA